MTKEELKELENLKDFKVYVFEGDLYVKAEDFRKKAIECRELREKLAEEGIRMDMMNHYNEIKEENEKLKLENAKLRDRIITDENFEDKLEEENKKLSEENGQLKEKLEQIKETYIRFEDSEKEYNKGLGELDQLIMNR